MSIYTKDKTHRITLRLNDEQFDFVTASADFYGISPSDFLRQVIAVTMSTMKIATERIVENPSVPVNEFAKQTVTDMVAATEKEFKGKEQVTGRENDKTDQHDIV